MCSLFSKCNKGWSAESALPGLLLNRALHCVPDLQLNLWRRSTPTVLFRPALPVWTHIPKLKHKRALHVQNSHGPEFCSSPLGPETRLRLGNLDSPELPTTQEGSEFWLSRSWRHETNSDGKTTFLKMELKSWLTVSPWGPGGPMDPASPRVPRFPSSPIGPNGPWAPWSP